MIITSVINKPLTRILFGEVSHINPNYPVSSGSIDVWIRAEGVSYFEYFGVEDFVYGLNFDRDNFVIFNNYLKLIYQKGKDFDIATYLSYAKNLVNKSVNLLISNKMTLSIETDNNGEDYFELESSNTTFFINLTHKQDLVKKFRGVKWWDYDIVIAIKNDKIYILILNQ